VISHHIINKYTVEKSTVPEQEAKLSMDNMEGLLSASLCSDIKQVHLMPSKTADTHGDNEAREDLDDKGFNIESPTASSTGRKSHLAIEEQEDEELLAKGQEFEGYILRFKSKFAGKVYRVAVNEGHALRHPESGIS
jgi:hypothetical protein